MDAIIEQSRSAATSSIPACQGMAVTAFPRATEVACEILGAGGNAIDAAVAAAWALAVCEPSGSGIGGQTIILLFRPGQGTIVLDGHSRAPAGVSLNNVSARQQRRGHRACTIPSTPAVLEAARQRFGRMSLHQIITPAIQLAEEGYRLTPLQHRQLKWCFSSLRASPSAAPLFLNRARPYEAGQLFRQPVLGATLRRIAVCGVDDFYRGQIARDIAADMRENGGLLTEQDLSDFSPIAERSSVQASCRGRDIVTVPPPAGGLQVLLGMKILEQFNFAAGRENLVAWYETLAEVIYTVFRERERQPLHPAQFRAELVEALVSNERATRLAEAIHGPCFQPAGSNGRGCLALAVDEEDGETTHLCIVDGEGNVVSLTQSLQTLFGAKVACARRGFLYNNYLLTCPRGVHPHQLGSRCLPRSNAAPTIVVQRRQTSRPRSPAASATIETPLLVLGAAGSRRITSAILHVISGIYEMQLSLREAVCLPRIHAKLSRKVWLEEPAVTQQLRDRLKRRFVHVEPLAPTSYVMGCVQAIQFHENATIIGVADPRREGTAQGLASLTGGTGPVRVSQAGG